MNNKTIPEVSPRKRLDYLLGLLQEEAAEIVQETSKTLRFGMYEQYTPEHPTNIQRVINEVKDLLTITEIIHQEFGIDFVCDEEYFNTKSMKIEKYSNLSRELGLLED